MHVTSFVYNTKFDNFYIFYRKTLFCRPFKSDLNIKTLTCILIKKVISYSLLLWLKSWLEKDAISAGPILDFLQCPTTHHPPMIKVLPKSKNEQSNAFCLPIIEELWSERLQLSHVFSTE